MKIVQTIHGFPPSGVGGTECYVQRITEELRDRGHGLFVYAGSIEWMKDFTVETAAHQGYELTRVHRNDLYFDRWDKMYNPLVEEHFSSYLAARKPDLVHVHHWIRLTSNLCAIAARAGYPVVVTLHDLYATCPRLFRMKKDGSCCDMPLSPKNCAPCADRRLFQKDPEIRYAIDAFKADVLRELGCATRILSPSSSHAATLTEQSGFEENRIEVQPLGSLVALKPAPRTPSGGKLRLVYLGQLYPHKGPELLIEAYGKMKHRDRAELHLFGGELLPEFTAKLKAIAEGLDVTFHGVYTPRELETFPMDLVVIPSLVPESYSFVLDEASWLKVPVLAADAGAIPERTRGSAMLFRRGDGDDLARAMDRLVSEPALLDDLRSTPPIQVMPMAGHIRRLEEIYLETVETGAKNAGDDHHYRRLVEQWERREFNFKELVRTEHWETLAASLKKRIEELEKTRGARK